MLTLKELARTIRVADIRIIRWRKEGRIIGHRSNYRTEYLYDAPTAEQVATLKRRKRS